MNKLISIVIILKNDLGIIDTITGLNQQDYKGKFEIIVVDRSTINYPIINSKIPVTWVKFDPKGKRFTIPHQRNLGVKTSQGDIIAFLDANCLPNKDWLSKLVAPIIEEGENIVAGVTLSRHKETINDIGYQKLKTKKYIFESGTNNLTFKKEIVKKIGYFDESFDYGSDVEFTWRAVRAGYKIRFVPDAISYHDWGGTKEELGRTLLYGSARARILFKHWRTHWQNLLGQDSPVILYPTLILLLPLIFIFPWYPLVFVLLVLKNINEPNPVGIVLKHIVYGWGVLTELKYQMQKLIFGHHD